MDAYTPIDEYGLIGNLETCGLVSTDGSIDWCPMPHLESSSLFTRLLDAEDGGHFQLTPASKYESSQRYLDRSNVLQTTFETARGRLVVTDFMPTTEMEARTSQMPVVFRKATCERGVVDLEVEFRPRFDYARAPTKVEQRDGGLLATGDGEQAFLTSTLSFDVSNETEATATVSLGGNETEWFVFCYDDDEPRDLHTASHLYEETVEYWRGWAHTCDESKCVFGGPWHDLVVRSALALKLLTHRDTGAIAAAATTSLPEEIGGVRNWDYRFNWIRDAAFTIQALSALHHTTEASDYLDWFVDLCRTTDPDDIQPLYGLHGETTLNERVLDHLSGYRGSAPVRIGNGAAEQRQLDVFGEIVLAVYLTVSNDGDLAVGMWDQVRPLIDFVCDVWTETDAGIWEVRGGERHFVFSKVMCWVALDRGLKLAATNGFDAPVERWRAVRDEIKKTVLDRGYDQTRGTFVQSFGDDRTLDATALLIPIVGFLPFADERVQGTIDAVQEELTTEDGLVRRYNGEDGLPGDEGAFVLCSFWLVDALALSGRIDEAKRIFLNVLEHVSPLGLFAEELDPETGEQLGNFPQAFSHVGLINSALYLGKATGRGGEGFDPMGIYSTDETTL